MRRRELITLLGGAAVALPFAERADLAGKVPTIGFIGTSASGFISWSAAFAERLQKLGWIEGRTVAIEYRWSEGRPERVAEIAAEFVQQKVDLIVAYGGAVTTLKQATASIPIVFAIAVDPVGVGLVANLSHPGGNVTGLSLQVTDAAGKRLELLRSFPNLAGWDSCLTPATPPPCKRRARFRLWLARSASKSCHKRYGEQRISQPLSMPSKAKWMRFI